MSEAYKCTTVSIGVPKVKLTIIRPVIFKDGAEVTTIYRSDDISRYEFGAEVKYESDTNISTFNVTMELFVTSGSTPKKVVTTYFPEQGAGTRQYKVVCKGKYLKEELGINTIGDLLNYCGVSATATSCSFCVKLIWPY